MDLFSDVFVHPPHDVQNNRVRYCTMLWLSSTSGRSQWLHEVVQCVGTLSTGMLSGSTRLVAFLHGGGLRERKVLAIVYAETRAAFAPQNKNAKLKCTKGHQKQHYQKPCVNH